MYLYFVSRRLRIFCLKEAVSAPIFGTLARHSGVIPYDRDAKGGFDFKAFKTTDEILEGNGCVVMFPQGHIVEDGKLEGHDLKQGIATHALRRDVPIIPMVFGEKTKPFKLNKIYIGNPIYPKDYFEVVEPNKENIAKFTEIIQQKMVELQSISRKQAKKVKEK
jgi:1-acyl-sn-glycerol-3-phosphate acyltransferase